MIGGIELPKVVDLNPDFGTCGWSGASGLNPMPFVLSETILRNTSSDWVTSSKTAKISGNSVQAADPGKNAHIHIFPNAYADFQCPITYSGGKVFLKASPPYPLKESLSRFRFKNIPITEKNTYYYDYQAKAIRVATDEKVYITNKKPILSISDTKGKTYKDITFVGGLDGVILKDCSQITFQNCTFMHIPRTAIQIQNCSNITIQDCRFLDCGKGAIRATACGDFSTLIPSNIVIKNCTFSECNSLVFSNSAYIEFSGVGLFVQGCTFIGSTGAAIKLQANDTEIKNCRFEDCCSECADFGIIYQGRSFIRRGLQILGCRFSGLSSGLSPKHAIYMDDGQSGVYVQGCVFERIAYPNSCFFGYGRNLTIENCQTYDVDIAFRSGPPRLHPSAVSEYHSLMANPSLKKLYIIKYPALIVPLDFSGNLLKPQLRVYNCKLFFKVPKDKKISSCIIFNGAPESTMRDIKIIKK